MTREEALEQEARKLAGEFFGHQSTIHTGHCQLCDLTIADLVRRVVALGLAAEQRAEQRGREEEREACAKVAETQACPTPEESCTSRHAPWNEACNTIAEYIRDRATEGEGDA